MSVETLGAIVSIASVVMASLLFIIRSQSVGNVTRLDGRIDSHESGCEQRQKGIDQQLTDIKEAAGRMESKLDSLVMFVAQRKSDDRRS